MFNGFKLHIKHQKSSNKIVLLHLEFILNPIILIYLN